MNQKPTLFTLLSPALLHLYPLENTIVVIIDVFRATSTIATALHNGATRVIPVAGIDECKAIGAKIENAITAGEREGKVIEGLQYGNSPGEYTRELISGRTLVLTTTNGTKLLHNALQNGCDEIITGSFVNINSVCNYLISLRKNVILGCSAWKDRFNLEDTLFAGAVVHQIKDHFIIHDDASLMAEEMHKLHKKDLHQFIRKTTHWHRLSAYGQDTDLDYCITLNAADVLPVYKNGELILA